MNTHDAGRFARRIDRTRRLRALGRGLGLLGVLALATAGCFRPSHNVQALRDSLFEAGAPPPKACFELGLGRLTVGAVCCGLNALNLPPQARAALDGLRGVELGVYRVEPGSRDPGPALRLARADRAMAGHGWARTVAVAQRNQLAGVYTPSDAPVTTELKLCLFVLDERQLVVVSARGNPEPLLRALDAPGKPTAPKARGWARAEAVGAAP